MYAGSATLKTVDRQAAADSSTSRHCGTASLDAVAVNRFDHDSLAARLAEHFGNPIAVSHKRAAGWSTASGGSGRAPEAVARLQRESVTSAARRGDASRSGW